MPIFVNFVFFLIYDKPLINKIMLYYLINTENIRTFYTKTENYKFHDLCSTVQI